MRRRSAGGRGSAAFLAFVLASMAAPPPIGASALAPSATGSDPTAARNAASAVQAAPPLDVLVPTVGGFVPTGGVGVRSVASPAKPPATPTEVAGLRGEFQRVTANPNGTFTAQVSLGRINYRDAAGAWQPIDTTLVPTTTDGYGLAERANDLGALFATANGADKAAELSAGGHALRFRVVGLGAGVVAPTGHAVGFADAGAGAVAFTATPGGLEFSTTYAGPGPKPLAVLLDTGGLTASVAADGQTVVLTDATGAPVGQVGAPTVLDAAGQMAPPAAVQVQLQDLPAGTDVTTVLPTFGPSPSSSPTPAPTSVPTATATQAPSASANPSTLATGSLSAGPSVDASTLLDTPPASILPTASDVLATPAPTAAASPSPAPSLAPSPTPAPSPSPSPVASPTPTPAPSATATPTPPASPSPAPTDLNAVRPDEVLLTYAVDPTWLAAPERAYPVVLDPTACIRYGGSSGCTINGGTGYRDAYVESGSPDTSPTGTTVQIGYDSTAGLGQMRGEFFPPMLALPDGAVVTNATFTVNEEYSYTGRTLITQAMSQPWPFGNATWNNQPAVDTSVTQSQASGGAGDLALDVTPIVRRWYTRNPLDWKADSGIRIRLNNETSNCTSADSTCWRMYVWAGSGTVPPVLTITYDQLASRLDFDPSLGADFAPSAMPAGLTTTLPVTLKNSTSALTYNHCVSGSVDCYKVGYRWFTSTGGYVSQTGFTSSGTADLAADLAHGATSATISLPVAAPPNPGQYSLRLDLVRQVNGTNLWASDWAQPSLFLARVKDPLAQPSNVRWVGNSIVARSEFPIGVVAGGGTAGGETKSVDLPDGSSLGINVWSRNFTYTGTGGVGFADLGGPIDLAYAYNTRDRTDCSGILAACGWTTNFDQGLTSGANGADYVYRDAAGNRYAVDATPDGQLTSAAPVRIERYRVTLVDENNLATWSNGAPTLQTAGAFNGSHDLAISSTNTLGTQSTSFHPVDLTHDPLVSFAVKSTAAGAAIGFHVHDLTTGSSAWLFYTVGTDFSVGSFTKVALGGSVGAWNQTFQRSLLGDVLGTGLGGAYDALQVDSLDFMGSGAAGT